MLVALRLGRIGAVLSLAVSVLVPAAHAGAGASSQPDPVSLKVAEFNIEYGGTHVSFDKVVQAIERSRADVVGIEEAQTHIPRLARALGWAYFSTRMQLVSKYPLIDPPGGDGIYEFVQLAPGEVVAIENVHLPSNPYGPFRIKQGATRKEVLELERRLRLPAIRPSLRAATDLQALGIPVFLVGDFNSPSWRDWTKEMVGVRYQIRFPVKWPVSVAVEDAGFVDSYRAVHPSPLKDPGLTWWAARPTLFGGYPNHSAPQDRIDLVYAAGDTTPTESLIVGETDSPLADIGVDPWPSDHRMVVSRFTVTPATEPVLVAVEEKDRLVDIGEPVDVVFHGRGEPGEHVAIVTAGGDPASGVVAEQATGPGHPPDGSLVFETIGWTAGAYEAVLLDGSDTELSRIPFWVKEPDAGPEISTGEPTYAVGEGVDVHWTNSPGNRWDWVGIYKRGRDPHVVYYLLWAYTHNTIQGSLTIDDTAHGPWPLPAGKYSVYLLADDGYKLLAGSPFSIG
jgi:endonuclease/exonuclease/phosphatase family metal-dependent hydrolase